MKIFRVLTIVLSGVLQHVRYVFSLTLLFLDYSQHQNLFLDKFKHGSKTQIQIYGNYFNDIEVKCKIKIYIH